MTAATQLELKHLAELTARIGQDPLLTQASTGNSSAKLEGVLWIKASGRWMADALRDDILIPLKLAEVVQCLREGFEPSERFPDASFETAMHAVLPQRVAIHVHSVNTIAWAVREDAFPQLKLRMEGLRWEWIPYTPSGLPLSFAIEHALSRRPDADVFVLGNHGLVVAGNDARAVEELLAEVERRLNVLPRREHPADYSVLAEICEDSRWSLPDDDAVHALGADAISRKILAGGVLYPCQALFTGCGSSGLFRSIPYTSCEDGRYSSRPFLIVEGRGVVVNRTARPAEVAMLSGLAQVIRRLTAATGIRYLTDSEVEALSSETAHRYRELANAGSGGEAEAMPLLPAIARYR